MVRLSEGLSPRCLFSKVTRDRSESVRTKSSKLHHSAVWDVTELVRFVLIRRLLAL
jgi:hypothetical protein